MARTPKLRTRSIIPIAFPVDDGKVLARAAGIRELPLSTFVRESAVAEAKRVIAEQQHTPSEAA